MKERKIRSAPLRSNQRRAPELNTAGKRDIPEGWQREPQKEHKLERVVEGEPVDDADERLENAGALLARAMPHMP